jgi:GNAT superfamily N-acetyltransferase
VIRFATPEDSELVLALVTELADYEKLSHEVVGTVEDVRASLGGDRPAAEALLAFHDGAPAGFALFFHNYSTFLARRGIYLEDLFVRPQFRGKGIGRALLASLARIACDRKCGRLEWAVLDWNVPALGFYEKLGARVMSEWRVHRLTGASLEALAGEAND